MNPMISNDCHSIKWDGDRNFPPAAHVSSQPLAGAAGFASVAEAIPASCYANPRWKGLAYFFKDYLVHFAILFGLAVTDRWFLLIPLFVLSSFSVSSLFIVGHDAAHDSLFRSKNLNYWVGRFAMVPSLHVYESWVVGHNRLHHGFTARHRADFVWHPLTIEDWGEMNYLQRAISRFEWSWLGAGFYYIRNVWLKMVDWRQPGSISFKVHKDQTFLALASLVYCGIIGLVGLYMYGSYFGAVWMVSKLVLIPAFLFMYCIGIVVYMHHISPDIQWHGASRWDRFKGQVEATTNLTMPFGLDFFFHYIMLHVPHHVDVRIPFYNLPNAVRAINSVFPHLMHEGRFDLADYWRSTRNCKLYNFDAGTWIPYPEKV